MKLIEDIDMSVRLQNTLSVYFEMDLTILLGRPADDLLKVDLILFEKMRNVGKKTVSELRQIILDYTPMNDDAVKEKQVCLNIKKALIRERDVIIRKIEAIDVLLSAQEL